MLRRRGEKQCHCQRRRRGDGRGRGAGGGKGKGLPQAPPRGGANGTGSVKGVEEG
jgi:hypothetical protein